MRPRRSTWVASMTSMPAPELASMPRWVMCQSLPTPSSALYWHIGATTMRLESSRPASFMGENRALMTDHLWADGVLRGLGGRPDALLNAVQETDSLTA